MTYFANGANKPIEKKEPRRVLIVGPESWLVEDLQRIKEHLERKNVRVTTYRADDGLRLSDVIDEMPAVDVVVIALEPGGKGWCANNSGRLSQHACDIGVKFHSSPMDPISAANLSAAY